VPSGNHRTEALRLAGERQRVNLGAIGQVSVQFAEHLWGIIKRDVALRDIVNYAGQHPISAIHGFVEVVLDIPHEVANQELGRVGYDSESRPGSAPVRARPSRT
jgi:hypothetical protein